MDQKRQIWPNVKSGRTKTVTKAEFARRLEHALAAKGWNGSDLVRAVNNLLGPGANFSRLNVSRYLRMRSFPHERNLAAIARALGMEAHELDPRPRPDRPNVLEMEGLAGGRCWLTLAYDVSMTTAVKIVELVNADR